MIKPNLIASHDWHVQPNCQRSLWTYRLSGAPLDRVPGIAAGVFPGIAAGVSSNLMRSTEKDSNRSASWNQFFRGQMLTSSLHPAFLREPFKGTKAPTLCQGRNLIPSCPEDDPSRIRKIDQRVKARRAREAQNIKEQPAKAARAARARRISPGSCNGLFSLGIPYRGSGVLLPTSPDPTNQFHHSSFPLPSIGAGPLESALSRQERPPGGSTAHLVLPKSNIRHPRLQPPRPEPPRLQLCEHTNRRRRTQARGPVESGQFCGKRREAELADSAGMAELEKLDTPLAPSPSAASPADLPTR
jgi:hypothetical protein